MGGDLETHFSWLTKKERKINVILLTFLKEGKKLFDKVYDAALFLEVLDSRIYSAIKRGSMIKEEKNILVQKIPFPAIRLESSSGEILSFDSLREARESLGLNSNLLQIKNQNKVQLKGYKIIEYKARKFPVLHYHYLHNN